MMSLMVNHRQKLPLSAGWAAVVQLFEAGAAWCSCLGI